MTASVCLTTPGVIFHQITVASGSDHLLKQGYPADTGFQRQDRLSLSVLSRASCIFYLQDGVNLLRPQGHIAWSVRVYRDVYLEARRCGQQNGLIVRSLAG